MQQQKISQFILACTLLKEGQSVLAVRCNEVWDSQEDQPRGNAVTDRPSPCIHTRLSVTFSVKVFLQGLIRSGKSFVQIENVLGNDQNTPQNVTRGNTSGQYFTSSPSPVTPPATSQHRYLCGPAVPLLSQETRRGDHF